MATIFGISAKVSVVSAKIPNIVTFAIAFYSIKVIYKSCHEFAN